MNPLLLLGGTAGGLAVINKNNKGAVSGGINPGQPSQKYPFRAPQPKRSDNASQPWAGLGIQAIVRQASTQVAADPMGSIKAGSSVVHSLSDVWGQISGIFGSNDKDADQNLMNPDQVEDSYMNEMELGSLDDQSNSVGIATSDALGYDTSSSYSLGVDTSMGDDNYSSYGWE